MGRIEVYRNGIILIQQMIPHGSKFIKRITNIMSIIKGNITTVNGVHGEISLNTGKIHLILGANGCGKTTLLKTVLGLVDLKKGRLFYGEKPLDSMSLSRRSRIMAYVPQFFNVNIPMSVLEVVAMGRVDSINPFAGLSTGYKNIRERALRLLTSWGIAELADRSVDKLSGGELAVVNMARAVMQDTEFILVDEADASLDIKRAREFYQVIRRLAYEEHKGIAMVTHRPHVVLSLRDDDKVFAVMPGGIMTERCVREVDSAFLSEVYGCQLKVIETSEGRVLADG